MEIFAVHGQVVVLDHIMSAMDIMIVYMEKMNKIAVSLYNYIYYAY